MIYQQARRLGRCDYSCLQNLKLSLTHSLTDPLAEDNFNLIGALAGVYLCICTFVFVYLYLYLCICILYLYFVFVYLYLCICVFVFCICFPYIRGLGREER